MLQHSIPVIFLKYIIPFQGAILNFTNMKTRVYCIRTIIRAKSGLAYDFPINIFPRTTYENCTVGTVPEASQNPV